VDLCLLLLTYADFSISLRCGLRLKMPRESLTQLRLKAGLSVSGLARLANLDRATVVSAEAGGSCRAVTFSRIANALSSALGRTVEIEEIT
jgi:predicted transcriptional regulator